MGGADEHNQGVVKAEIFANAMVLLDFGGIGGHERVTIGPKLEAQYAWGDGDG
ncbi:MAG: hypothetical protein AAB385_03280 [Planctomycetota bacterium]